MKRYTLYLGLNDKDTKQQKIATIEAYKIVENLIANNFNGATIFDANGIYKHNDNTIIIKNTLRIEILEFDDSIIEQIKTLVDTLKVIFNQESIAVNIEAIASELW